MIDCQWRPSWNSIAMVLILLNTTLKKQTNLKNADSKQYSSMLSHLFCPHWEQLHPLFCWQTTEQEKRIRNGINKNVIRSWSSKCAGFPLHNRHYRQLIPIVITKSFQRRCPGYGVSYCLLDSYTEFRTIAALFYSTELRTNSDYQTYIVWKHCPHQTK